MTRRFKTQEGPAGRFLIDDEFDDAFAAVLSHALAPSRAHERYLALLDANCGAVLFDCRLLVMKGGDVVALLGGGVAPEAAHFACVIEGRALVDFDLSSCNDVIGCDGIALALDGDDDAIARAQLPDGYVLVWQPRRLPLGTQ